MSLLCVVDPGKIPEPNEWNNIMYFRITVLCAGGEFDNFIIKNNHKCHTYLLHFRNPVFLVRNSSNLGASHCILLMIFGVMEVSQSPKSGMAYNKIILKQNEHINLRG